MSNAATLRKIETVTPGRTYRGTSETELTAPGYYLEEGDTPRRWNIKSEKSGRVVALLVCTDL